MGSSFLESKLQIQKMSKSEKIKQFVSRRISEIDQNYEKEADIMGRLKLSTMRTSFANILNVYLNEEGELGISYYKHAITYSQAGCYDQAIFYAQLAKKHLKDSLLIEESVIINLNCLLKLARVDEAYDLLKQIKPSQLKQQYYEIKCEIMEKLRDQEQTNQSLENLGQIIQQKYTKRSSEMGLYLIDKGRKKGSFGKFDEAIKLMHEGMDILIEVRYKDHIEISKIYLLMAQFSRELKDLQSQYTSLICAHSMIRQSTNRDKELVETLHKIVNNLLQREDYEGGLKQLLKIQILEKHIYGESSLTVGKTLKTISQVFTKMNHRNESRKYQQEYNRIICCNDRKGLSRQKPLKYSQIKSQN